ncbi:MAG TPA: hypothetical protein DEF26_01805 [Acinetobacter sp.]|nr:hypothetical protein [Acinetobacter sp.]
MKKLFSVLFSASVLTLTACNKQPAQTENSAPAKDKTESVRTIKLVSTGSAVTTGDQSLEEAVNAEARKIANDDKYQWLPVGKVGVNFYW